MTVVLRLLLPRQAEGPKAFRPFYVSASDVDVLVELKPEGRVCSAFLVAPEMQLRYSHD